jgi:hypothetical protein
MIQQCWRQQSRSCIKVIDGTFSSLEESTVISKEKPYLIKDNVHQIIGIDCKSQHMSLLSSYASQRMAINRSISTHAKVTLPSMICLCRWLEDGQELRYVY